MRSALLTALVVLLTSPATAVAAPTVSVPSWITVPETAGEARITVTLSEPPTAPFSVSWRTASASRWVADGSDAIPGTDYAPASGTLEFATGQTQREVAVTISDDAVDDSSPSFAVEFGDLGHDPRTPVTLVDILDDEPTPAASVADVRVDESTGEAVVPVTRPAISRIGNASYDWWTENATAAAPADFTAQRGTVTISSEQERAEVRIPILDDAVAEPDESLRVLLAPATELTSPWGWFRGPVADGLATVTIADDDAPRTHRTVASATRVRGRVTLDGLSVLTPLEFPLGSRVDVRRGVARIAVALDARVLRWATIAGGAVRLERLDTLALLTRALDVRATRGLRVRARTVTSRAVTDGVRWRLTETKAGTRVRVRRGMVRAHGALLRAGDARVFRRP